LVKRVVDCARQELTCRSGQLPGWPGRTRCTAGPTASQAARWVRPVATRLGRPDVGPGRQRDDRDQERHLPALRAGGRL